MGSYDRGENRGGYHSRGRSSFGGGRSFDRGGDRGRDRQMFSAICSNCGKECQVPFRPTGGKPVYCSDCFEKMGGRSSDSRPERSDRPRPDFTNRAPAPSFDQNKSQLDAINAKLDRLLELLEPKAVETAVITPASEDVTEPKKPASKKKK